MTKLWQCAPLAVLLFAACTEDAPPARDSGAGSDAVPSGDGGTPQMPVELRSMLARAAPDATDATTLGRATAAFGLALHRAAATAGRNTVMSPYSVSVALAMARAGAAGTTGTEMDAAMRVTLAPERQYAAHNAVAQALAGRAAEATRADPEPTVPRPALVLRTVNDVWASNTLRVVPAYLDTLAVDFGAGLRVLDFGANPELARMSINRYISDQTMARIPELIPRGQITGATRVVLTNAVYFNARWVHRFNPDYTGERTFTRADGSTVRVQQMRPSTAQQFGYAEGSGWKAVEMPYVGDQLAMLVVVPDAGTFDAFEGTFDGARYEAIVSALRVQTMNLSVPRFRVRSPALLKTPLQSLGMRLAFTNGADFSGMTAEPLHIEEVIHEGFIDVTEAGTEAAAATAVVFADSSIGPTLPSFDVERAFYYFIRDRGTGAVLFIGRVLDPTQS